MERHLVSGARRWPAVTAATLALGLGLVSPAAAAGQAAALSGPLVVYNAGSLAGPVHRLLGEFAAAHPGIEPAQENSGSVEAVRKVTDLHRVPDLLALADYRLIPTLLIPRYAASYVPFARNAMVLAYTGQSLGARRIDPGNWWRLLPGLHGVRVGHSDPALDPAGYRALMVGQLAERYYREPKLAARLAALTHPGDIRPKSAELTALLQAGELDYAWIYRSAAETAHLRYLALPPEIDLSDPARADDYAAAVVDIPKPGGGTLTLHGEPILYGVTIPTEAPHPAAARAFLDYLLSDAGQRALREAGFLVIAHPRPAVR